MPNVLTHLVECAGHVVHVDNPEAVLAHMVAAASVPIFNRRPDGGAGRE